VKKLASTSSLPWGTSLSSALAASSKNAEILASQVLTLTGNSSKIVNSKSKEGDELLLEDVKGKSHKGAQLWYGMEALQQLVYTKGSVASIFANIVSKAWTFGQDFIEDFSTAIVDIFHEDENPDLVSLTTALEQDTSEGQAYLVVMNDNVGFTLLHNLQCIYRKIWPGDPISSKFVAFGGDILPVMPHPTYLSLTRKR
jgi:hypothetical protein